MQRDSIIFMLKAHGVTEENLASFSLKLRDKSFTIDDCDNLLVKLGYEKLFTVESEHTNQNSDGFEEDEYDNDLDSVDDDSYSDYESFNKKHTFNDE